jgi:integrase
MPEDQASRRRGHREDSIYLDVAHGRYVGAVSLGYAPNGRRIRRKVSGKTKQEVRDKLKALHAEIDSGLKSSAGYTVGHAIDDWLRDGLDGRSDRTRTLYAGLMASLKEHIGPRPLRSLSAGEVRWALTQLAPRFSRRSLQIARNCLERAIRQAQADNLVNRNVASLVNLPTGREGRPSKSFTVEEAQALLAVSEGRRLHAYITLSLLVGLRTEEARALRWDHVVVWVTAPGEWRPVTDPEFVRGWPDVARFAIYVWRSERFGGDTKTGKSRRTLALPKRCVDALREQWELQERERVRAGELWEEHGLVFASRIGTPLSANNVIRAFRIITKAAGLGDNWVPREMRHTFVSLLSARGVPAESIALLAGHDRTATTELVYRHEIRPALTQGAEVMDQIFG